MQYLWLAFILLSGLVEALTVQLVAIWFIPGALIAMILAFLNVAIWIQVTVFLVLAVVCLALAKTVFREFFAPKKEKFNIDAIIGEKCLVTERIDNIAGRGAVKVKGLEWAARMISDDTVAEAGERVEVLAVEGVKLICKKI
jgi:membrane protein implicated in regulation of membrane protease activity